MYCSILVNIDSVYSIIKFKKNENCVSVLNVTNNLDSTVLLYMSSLH